MDGPTDTHAGRTNFFFARAAVLFFSALSTASACATTDPPGVCGKAPARRGAEEEIDFPVSPPFALRRAEAAKLKRMVSNDRASPRDRTRDHRRGPPRISSRSSDWYRRS